MKTYLILILLIGFKPIDCFNQNVDKSEFIDIVYEADSLANINDIENAEKMYLKAEEHYRVNKDWDNWYSLIKKIRRLLTADGSYEKIVFVLRDIKKSIPLEENSIRGKISFNIGFYLGSQVRVIGAIAEYKKSLSLFELIPNKTKKDKNYIALNYKNISNNYSKLGDQKSAIQYVNYGIEYCNKNGMSNRLCDLNLNKGQFYYYDNQPEEAIKTYLGSFEICDSDQDKATSHALLANLYLHQNNLAETEIHLGLANKLNPNKGEYYSTVYANYLFEKGDFAKSKIAKVELIKLLEGGIDTKYLIKEVTKFSMDLYKIKEREEALKYAHKALSLFYTDLNKEDVFERPVESELLPYTYIIEALNIKAKYYRDKYIETKDESSLREATYYYNLLLSHFDKLKSKYYSSSSQYRMGAYSQEIYSDVISFFIDQYGQDNKVSNLENAFSLAQRANSFVLRNAVSNRKALEMAGVNQDSLDQYLFLASKASSDNEEDTTGVGIKVLLEFDAYKESLFSNYPTYGKYEREEEITIKEVQSTLDENAIVLKYYYYDKKLSVFGITKNSIFAENIPFPKVIDSLINSNLEIISQDQSNDSLINMYLTNSKTVYDLVVGDLLQKYSLTSIDHLIIIPDGPLKKVSFNALAIKDSEDWNDPNTYLMSKYSVNYLYYCSQLKNINETYESKDGFIGFGIEYEDDFLKEIIGDYMSSFKDGDANSRAISLSPLKYADDEVLTTAEILGGTSFINSEVTLSQVYSTINNFDVVHFSAHAFVDESDYLNSFVVLNRDDGEDYQLKYSDILNLDIDSEMVVLSACQTGSGKSVVGEGLMSLSRAFVQSGSSSAVGAYWNAPDYATKELMTLFYSNLKEGMSKSKAMQQAQIEYLTNDEISSPTIRSPFFWASWAVYGDDQPLRMNSSLIDFSSWKTYLVLILGLFFVFILIRYFTTRKSS